MYPATASVPGTQRAFSVFATLFMVIVAAVLWVACSNVAILQLVRSAARRHEMAIRLALGATRMQLVRQLLGLLPNRAIAITAGMLGLVALALGILGTYSVMAFLVVQRRREIGIRLALGALPSRIAGMIAGQGARWIGSGLVIGAVGGVAALRLLQGLVVGVSARDPLSVTIVLLLLGGTGCLATYLPARAAGKGDPSLVLRQ